MATYFHGGAEMQAATGGGGGDNLQTLYLMNPNYATSSAYYEGQHQLLLNPNTLTMPHQPPHQQLIGIPLSGPHHSSDLGRLSQFNNSNNNNNNNNNSNGNSNSNSNNNSQIQAGMHGLALQRAHYNLWSPTSGSSPVQPGTIHDLSGQAGFRSPGQGGLSLSLSPGERGQHGPAIGREDVRMSVTVASGPGSGNGAIIGSKYLRATQELLEEVVNVGGIIGTSGENNGESSGVHKVNKAKAVIQGNDDDMTGVENGGDATNGGESSKKGTDQLSTTQRQELQMKKAKLLNMLDEVEQRYRQYHTQMQVIASSFEQAAGMGSSKTYTYLALKTISKQFRCLKDAITNQVKSTSKSLGEDDNNGSGGVKLEGGAGSRLRFVDQQLRQQRALQQLGMMHQHNAWRPQRGLPERAVSVLRAWLFEHFLHPYPKDSDKHMLAKQTGLTRSQVSNWFINARVRLWKPMVEEMYVEEMKTHDKNGGTSEENTNNANTTNTTATTTNNNVGIGNSSSKNEHNQDHYSTTTKTTIIPPQEEEDDDNNGGFSMIQTHQNDHNNHQTTNDMISSLSQSQGFTLIGSSSDMESLMAARSSQKKQRSNNSDINNNSPSSILSMDMEIKPIDHQRHHSASMYNPYIVNDIGRFNPEQLHQSSYHGNGVSLTLGLPDCDNNNLSISEAHHQQNFFPNQAMELGRRLDIGPGEADFCGISMAQNTHPTSNEYQSIDIQSRKRFAAQILHDFVA